MKLLSDVGKSNQSTRQGTKVVELIPALDGPDPRCNRPCTGMLHPSPMHGSSHQYQCWCRWAKSVLSQYLHSVVWDHPGSDPPSTPHQRDTWSANFTLEAFKTVHHVILLFCEYETNTSPWKPLVRPSGADISLHHRNLPCTLFNASNLTFKITVQDMSDHLRQIRVNMGFALQVKLRFLQACHKGELVVGQMKCASSWETLPHTPRRCRSWDFSKSAATRCQRYGWKWWFRVFKHQRLPKK